MSIEIRTACSNVCYLSYYILSKTKQALIKGNRYKEVTEADLKKKSSKSPLGLRFHLYDCVGAGLVHAVASPKGPAVYRLNAASASR